ncbi:hypothetical protein L1887_55765 [Cichorium endivia]|nr:hypothetical protein L1887_55765 [Cichorium endivia]
MLRLATIPLSLRSATRLASAPRLSCRLKSTLTVVPASSSAPREVPTPLLFLTASKWTSSPPAPEAYSKWIQHFSAQGYESLLLDLDPDQPVSELKDSAKLMEVFEKDAIDTLRQSGKTPPFPPIMITGGPASLIAQTYVSSRPLTALQLIDPPINNAYLRKDRPKLLPTELAEFDFEATFPVRVVWSDTELQRQQQQGVPCLGDQATSPLEDVDSSFETESDSDSAGEAAGMRNADGLPEWFVAGEYTLQPGSRKYPLTLDERDLAEKFVRGSGPGGQAINKLSTNVQLTHLPTGTRLTCQETRSRDRNRELARRRMSLVLEKLVRGESGGSRIDRTIEKERRKKSNKKKKQKRRQRDKLLESQTATAE